ncbi:glycosyltransferase family 4 protein [Roseateles sp. L2-2]|uniref:glycosyltransferase family 4 protein n=1 Tax=Roseateles sp. L2-2 TaxID=3422597 RepID=UPI003D360F99
MKAKAFSAAARPRALLVLSRFRPMIGGAERQCELLIEHLADRVEWVDVLTHRYDDQLPAREAGPHVAIQRLGRSGRKGASPVSFYAALVRAILSRRADFDLIHCHTAGMTGLMVAMVGRLLGKPVLLKLTAADELRHQMRPSAPGGGLASRFKNGVRRMLGRLAVQAPSTHVVALTLAGGDEARECAAGHVHVIPNGVEAERYDGLRRGPVPGELRFGYCGRLTAEKGTHVLAEAFSAVLSGHPGVSFLVAGSGDRQLASSEDLLRGLSVRQPGQVHLLGSLVDTRRMLGDIDVYVSASTYEGLPNAVLEALACGLPCVLSNIDAHREMKRLNPAAQIRLFEPNDPQACREALEQVCADWPLPASRLSDDLRMERVADRYLSLYQAMLMTADRSVT